MTFRTNAAPYQRTKNSTLRIMLILLAALLVVWGFAIAYSFKLDGQVKPFVDAFNQAVATFNEANAAKIEQGKVEAMEVINATNYGVRAILMVVISVVTTAICDVVTTLAKHKKGKGKLGEEILNDLVHNYSYITAVIFALTLPVYVSYYIVIIGAIFATVICKNFFGGFGKNIFNPAIMARIFVGLCFVNQFSVPELLVTAANGIKIGTVNVDTIKSGIDAISGATLTTAYNGTGWLSTTMTSGIETIKGSIFSDYSLMDLLMGRYLGALGETFTIVIFALGIILSILKVINWRTPVFYLGTVAVTSVVIALVLGIDNPLNYMLYHLSLGGLMFGAVFMITDPVTGPTSSFGKCLIGVFAGLMTMLIRVKGGYPEGVMFSIALANFISPAIDYFTVGKTSDHKVRKYAFVFGTLAVAIALNTLVAFKCNGGVTVYSINGIDKAEYNYIAEVMPLNEGDKLAVAENYQVKSDANVIKGFVVEKKEDSEVALDAVYYINNEANEKVATIYTVYSSYVISMEGYPRTVNSYVMVAINNDGSLYGFGFFNPINTPNYGLESAIEEYVVADYVGKNASNYASVDVMASATYSSNFIKQIIAAAYAEFNA